jgi:pimeloyl-ACP methyl ester carboxylesterase
MTANMMQPSTLEIAGGQLSYWEHGGGPPLVFIHGTGTTGGLWARDLEPLAAQYRVVVYDRRGYGASSASPRNWTAHRDDAAALIAGVNATNGVIVGYSAGASIALDLVIQRPDIASALVLVDPAFNLKRCLTFGMLRAVLKARILRRLRGDRAAAEAWIRYVASYSTGGTAFDKAPPERRETLLANASGLFADSDSGLPMIDEARLAEIRVPVTIIDAALSPSSFRKASARLQQLLPKARVVTLKNAGHHITLDARDELLAELRTAAITA